MYIGYVIATNPIYKDLTIPRLLKSLDIAKVPLEQRAIFVAKGCSPKEAFCIIDFNVYGVPYMSYELTALIGAVDVGLDNLYTHVFLLHDTCEVGPDFAKRTVANADPDADVTAVWGGMCSFGLYRTDFLRDIYKSYLEPLKNCDKHTSMINEGAIFRRKLGTVANYSNDTWSEHGMRDIYGTGQQRLVEYYGSVDMFKYKSNFGQTQPGSYTEVV